MTASLDQNVLLPDFETANAAQPIVPIWTPRASRQPSAVPARVQINIVPVVLAGGTGTRLWPLSRAMLPKQFIRFDAESVSSFEATLKRLHPAAGFAAPLVMCNCEHRFLVREQVERAGIAPQAIILEPVVRNTAAAIAVAALYLERHAPGAILAVLPADHLLNDDERFVSNVKRAAELAERGKLVLFGIRPKEAHTGYGYIRQGAAIDSSGNSAFTVDAFFEKPDRALAEHYVAAGGYHWNSGIFVMRAGAFIDELSLHAPDVVEAARAALANANEDFGFLRLDEQALASAPNISVDHAVMEKTAAAAVVPFDCDWSDVGSWSSLWDISPRDKFGNHVCGQAMLEDTSNCYVHSKKALVATLGIRDLVIVDTPDAILVADRTRTQDVSKIVARLRQSNRKEHEQHLRNLRPWGYFEPLSADARFQVKLLHVKPGAKLSLQMHHHRSEHWTVVQGTAKVVVGDVERLVRENESVYISETQWHRLENPGKVPLEVIEVQIGSYLGEDDIVRSDDVYHRSPDETR
jgi:mannose-1-phosphate guanylyltransferase/mannose-6-phosphate isomerase